MKNHAHPARLERAIEDLESTGLPIKPKGVQKGNHPYMRLTQYSSPSFFEKSIVFTHALQEGINIP